MALLSGGGYAEYCACDERHIMRIPTSLSFNEAAAIPEVKINIAFFLPSFVILYRIHLFGCSHHRLVYWIAQFTLCCRSG